MIIISSGLADVNRADYFKIRIRNNINDNN